MPELLIEIRAQKKSPLDNIGSNAHAPDTILKSAQDKVAALGLALRAFAWFLFDALALVPNCILKTLFPFDCSLPLELDNKVNRKGEPNATLERKDKTFPDEYREFPQVVISYLYTDLNLRANNRTGDSHLCETTMQALLVFRQMEIPSRFLFLDVRYS